MKFLVDAQLPRALVLCLSALGHDAVHVNDLPEGGRTIDRDVALIADAEGRVVVTKDADFRHTHETGGRPERLLHIGVGNVRNADLLDHVASHLARIIDSFEEADFVELGRETLLLHARRTL